MDAHRQCNILGNIYSTCRLIMLRTRRSNNYLLVCEARRLGYIQYKNPYNDRSCLLPVNRRFWDSQNNGLGESQVK